MNPFAYLLKLLPAPIQREVSLALSTLAGVLVIVNEGALVASPAAHRIIDGVLLFLASLGIRANVTPVQTARRVRKHP